MDCGSASPVPNGRMSWEAGVNSRSSAGEPSEQTVRTVEHAFEEYLAHQPLYYGT